MDSSLAKSELRDSEFYLNLVFYFKRIKRTHEARVLLDEFRNHPVEELRRTNTLPLNRHTK